MRRGEPREDAAAGLKNVPTRERFRRIFVGRLADTRRRAILGKMTTLDDDDDIERLVRERGLAAGYREAARRALAFARRYRQEEGRAGGARERACVTQANTWRRALRELRAPKAIASDHRGPGLARGREGAPHETVKKSNVG
jgi:hypothetical protein